MTMMRRMLTNDWMNEFIKDMHVAYIERKPMNMHCDIDCIDNFIIFHDRQKNVDLTFECPRIVESEHALDVVINYIQVSWFDYDISELFMHLQNHLLESDRGFEQHFQIVKDTDMSRMIYQQLSDKVFFVYDALLNKFDMYERVVMLSEKYVNAISMCKQSEICIELSNVEEEFLKQIHEFFSHIRKTNKTVWYDSSKQSVCHLVQYSYSDMMESSMNIDFLHVLYEHDLNTNDVRISKVKLSNRLNGYMTKCDVETEFSVTRVKFKYSTFDSIVKFIDRQRHDKLMKQQILDNIVRLFDE